MSRFSGQVLLITGGARGQGAAEAELLVREGAKVVVGDILDERGAALAAELGDAATYVHLDVTNATDWDHAVESAEFVGPLSGLVNNAGTYRPHPLMETDLELWDLHVQINQTGCFLGMKAVVPAMTRAGGGSIVNISSSTGFHGSPRAFAYNATKWALRGMTRSAALELAALKIRVNSVHPGPIDTEMLGGRTPVEYEALRDRVPMKRLGTANDVAQVVVFLLSAESAFVTGAEIPVDGGVSA